MKTRWILLLAAGLFLAPAGCQDPRWTQSEAVDHYIRGRVLADQGDANAALAELAEAIRQDPNLAVAHATMGDIFRRQGNLDQARQSYESACNSDPYAFRPHYNLAVTYQMLAQAANAFAKAEAYLQNAVRVYLRAVAIDPGDFDTNLNLSACYFQLNKPNLSEQYCLAAVKLNPRSPQAHGNLGVIYDSQGRSLDAVREYKTSLEIDEHQPQILLNLGAAYGRLDRPKLALTCFELSAKEDPNFAPAHEQIGGCHFRQGQYDKSLAAYEKAASVDPKSAGAYRGIGAAYMSQFVLDRQKTDLRDQALDAWQRSLELRPNQPDLARLVEKYRPDTSTTRPF